MEIYIPIDYQSMRWSQSQRRKKKYIYIYIPALVVLICEVNRRTLEFI